MAKEFTREQFTRYYDAIRILNRQEQAGKRTSVTRATREAGISRKTFHRINQDLEHRALTPKYTNTRPAKIRSYSPGVGQGINWAVTRNGRFVKDIQLTRNEMRRVGIYYRIMEKGASNWTQEDRKILIQITKQPIHDLKDGKHYLTRDYDTWVAVVEMNEKTDDVPFFGTGGTPPKKGK